MMIMTTTNDDDDGIFGSEQCLYSIQSRVHIYHYYEQCKIIKRLCVKSILHRSEEFGLFAESVMYVSRVFFTKCC